MARMKELERENAQLKCMYEDAQLRADVLCRGLLKKNGRPSQRVEMAKKAVANGALGVRQSCMAFNVSGCCYRYERKLSDENILVAELLLGLTQSQRNWGLACAFCICGTLKVIAGTISARIALIVNWS